MINLFKDELLEMRDEVEYVKEKEELDSDYMVGVLDGMEYAFEYLVSGKLPPDVAYYLHDIPSPD